MELICFAFAAPAVKVNWIVSLCPVAFAVTPAGASGGAAAWMAGVDSGECADSPAWFVAVTSYSYQELSLLTVNDALPLVAPVTTWVETGVPPNGPPLEAAWYSYTVYWVTGRPLAAVPLTGVQETVMARVAVGFRHGRASGRRRGHRQRLAEGDRGDAERPGRAAEGVARQDRERVLGAVGEPGERVRRRDRDVGNLLPAGRRSADLDLVAGDGSSTSAAGFQVSATVPSPGVAARPVTWSGTAFGVAVVVRLSWPGPTLLVAVT